MAQDVCVRVHTGPCVFICVGVHTHVCKRVLSSARRPEHLEAQTEQTRTMKQPGRAVVHEAPAGFCPNAETEWVRVSLWL